jgi:hypothetical protein
VAEVAAAGPDARRLQTERIVTNHARAMDLLDGLGIPRFGDQETPEGARLELSIEARISRLARLEDRPIENVLWTIFNRPGAGDGTRSLVHRHREGVMQTLCRKRIPHDGEADSIVVYGGVPPETDEWPRCERCERRADG